MTAEGIIYRLGSIAADLPFDNLQSQMIEGVHCKSRSNTENIFSCQTIIAVVDRFFMSIRRLLANISTKTVNKPVGKLVANPYCGLYEACAEQIV
jgi:hypothetical protein